MSRRSRRARLDIRAAIAITIALLAIAAASWRIAAIGYAALGLTWLVSNATLPRIRRALQPRTYRWRDVASPEDIHPRAFPQDVKVAAAVRDGGMCQCRGCSACGPPGGHWRVSGTCGSVHEIQFDHIRPWSLGGPSDLANCRTLCGPCNRTKGAAILP